MAAALESVFVSYAGPDQAWAEWVAWQLRDAGHRVELDVWDWQAGDNFVDRMNAAMQRATVVVALFSTSYFRSSRWTHEEWTSIVGRRERLVPLMIEPLSATDIPAILTAVIRKDLHGLDEPAAKAALHSAVNGPLAPATAPSYPGTPPLPNSSATGPSSQRPRLPSAAGIPKVWNVQRRNPHFTGRELLMAQVREGLLGGRQAVVQALHGLGGIGKTQIALEYAHRFASQYDTVWWIDAEQADQVPVHYAELATRLGIAKPEAGTEHNTRTLLEHLRTRDRWLIVLDNADRPQDFENLIPIGSGHVLITSRNPDWHENVHSLDLGVFSRSDSLAYLTARLPGIAPEQADALADDLGDLPLALAQAAGVISSGMTVDRYRRLLAEKTTALMANGTPPGYSAPLAASVDIAATRLAADHPGAAGLLRLGAFLGPDPVPTIWLETVADQLATVAVDPDDFMWPQAALQPLARYGLARVDYETFQIHRLTQAILRSQASKEEAAAAQGDVTTILAAVAPGDPETPSAWPQWAAFTSHLSARHHTATDHPQLRQALIQAALYLIRSGQPGAARELTTTLHRTWSSALGEDHEDTLACAQYLSHSTSDLGEHAEARRMIEDTLQRRRRILGDDHPDTLQSANDLGAALGRLGEHAEARRMHEDTLRRRRRILGDDHPDTLQSAHNLAVSLNHFGEHAEARRMHEDTLRLRRRILGDDHPDTLQSAHNLAVSLNHFGEHAEARRMHEDTLRRRRRILGDHPDTLNSAHSLAVTMHEIGEHAEARRMHEDTLRRRRRIFGDDHRDTLQSAHSLAVTMHNLGKYAEAQQMDEDTLRRRRRIFGDDHPDTLNSAHSLAVTMHDLGKYAEAEQMDEDTLRRRRRIFGDDHPDTLQSAHSLAITLSRLREFAEAVRLLKDARMRSRRILGNEHQFTRQVTHTLASALEAAGKPHEAQKLLASLKPRQRQTRKTRR